MTISKRKLESYKRAELVSRELRHQLGGSRRDMDLNDCVDFLIDWMAFTGKVKYERPVNNTSKKKYRDRMISSVK